MAQRPPIRWLVTDKTEIVRGGKWVCAGVHKKVFWRATHKLYGVRPAARARVRAIHLTPDTNTPAASSTTSTYRSRDVCQPARSCHTPYSTIPSSDCPTEPLIYMTRVSP